MISLNFRKFFHFKRNKMHPLSQKTLMKRVLTGNGVKYYGLRQEGSGWLSNAFRSLKTMATPFIKTAGQALLSSGKQLAPVLLNTAANKGLEALAKHTKTPDSVVNTLSKVSNVVTDSLDKNLNKVDPKAPPKSDLEKGISSFVTGESQKLLANLLARGQGVKRLGSGVNKLGNGVNKLGNGVNKLGMGLQIEEAPKI